MEKLTKHPYEIPIEPAVSHKKKPKSNKVKNEENFLIEPLRYDFQSDNHTETNNFNEKQFQKLTFEEGNFQGDLNTNEAPVPSVPKALTIDGLDQFKQNNQVFDKSVEKKPEPVSVKPKNSKIPLILSIIIGVLIIILIVLLVLAIVFGLQANQNTNESTSTSTTTSISISTTKLSCAYGFSGPQCSDECGKIYSPLNVKITNGKVANQGSWPSLAEILFTYKFDYVYNGSLFTHEVVSRCESTVISRNTVLTSSQCFPQKVSLDINGVTYWFSVRTNKYHSTIESMYKVSAGFLYSEETGNLILLYFIEANVPVSSIIIHPNFNSTTYLNDIAVIKLSRDLNLNQQLQIACLPDPVSFGFPGTGVPALAAGIDDVQENSITVYKIQNVNLTILSISDCTNNLAGNTVDGFKQICAGVVNSSSICEGDLGGPLFVETYVNGVKKFILAGIVSYKDSCKYSLPGIFTRVSSYVEWINTF